MLDFEAFQHGFDEYGDNEEAGATALAAAVFDDEVYKKYTDAIKITRKDYENYKNNLSEPDLELINVVEKKLENINKFKIDLLRAKFKVLCTKWPYLTQC